MNKIVKTVGVCTEDVTGEEFHISLVGCSMECCQKQLLAYVEEYNQNWEGFQLTDPIGLFEVNTGKLLWEKEAHQDGVK